MKLVVTLFVAVALMAACGSDSATDQPRATLTVENKPTTAMSRTPITQDSSTASPPPTASGGLFNVWEHPPTGEPYAIDGFRLVNRVGTPTVPNTPADVLALPDGTILVADTGLSRMFAFDADGVFLREWGDVDRGDQDLPIRLAQGPDGDVYVLYSTGLVQRFDAQGVLDREWSLDWGRGPASDADSIGSPTGLVVDRQGNLYVGTANLGSTFGFGPSLESIVMQFGPEGMGLLRWDVGDGCRDGDMAIDQEDRVYLACDDGIRLLSEGESLASDLHGETTLVWASGADVMGRPGSLAVAPDGTMLVLQSGGFTPGNADTDGTYHDWSMIHIDAGGSELDRWAVAPPGEPYYSTPPSVSFDATGERIYLPVPAERKVVVFDRNGAVVADIVEQADDTFTRIDRMAIDAAGNVYVLDLADQEIVRLDPDGEQVAVIPIPSSGAYAIPGFLPLIGQEPDLAVGPDGSIYYVTARHPGQILRFTQAGEMLVTWTAETGRFVTSHNPTSMALDAHGVIYSQDSRGDDFAIIDMNQGVSLGEWDMALSHTEYSAGDGLWLHDDTIYLIGYEGL